MSNNRKVKVLLADDQRVVLEGLRGLFSGYSEEIELSGYTYCANEVLQKVSELAPDVVIANPFMFKDGINAFQRMSETKPETGFIVLACSIDGGVMQQAAQIGKLGLVLRKSPFEELVRAVHTVHGGEVYICEGLRELLANEYIGLPGSVLHRDKCLDKRECNTIRLIASGMTNKQIAQELNKSPKTIDASRRKIMDKLEINSIAELVKYAIRTGLSEL